MVEEPHGMAQKFGNPTFDDIAKIAGALRDAKRILILGGIREAVDLAAMLVGSGHDVTTSLAGRTKEPVPVLGRIRIGGFGGANGLAAYVKDHAIDVLIDATHPFAKNISANAVLAAQLSRCELIVYARQAWPKLPGDSWLEVPTLEVASAAIPNGARVLLALGSQHLAQFSSRTDVHFIVRMVDQPTVLPSLHDFTLVLGKPGDVAAEAQLLKKHAITHIVCRNSGGVGAYAKIEAARNENLPVIIINR